MSVYEVLIYWATLAAAIGLGFACYPMVTHAWGLAAAQWEQYRDVRVQRTTKLLDDLYVEIRPAWLKIAYGIGPLITGLAAFALTNNMIAALLGAVAGLMLPDLWMRYTIMMRRKKFQNQLVDALFVLSSGLRAGLSLTQAIEQLETEMSPPASQEFGLVIKSHRLGRSLEAALQNLNDRMNLEEMNLITTAVLVARETGGDVTAVITQLVTSIREKKKLFDKINTLTLQGKLQAYIMSVLPIAFAFFARSINPEYFDLLFHDPMGNMMLMTAVMLWFMGMVLLFKMSRMEI